MTIKCHCFANLFALLSSVLLSSCSTSMALPESKPKPSNQAKAADVQDAPLNVLMIAIDDLNDYVGVLGGHPDASTPNIDRLARRGMLFTNAHTPSPVCNSARTAIMTGRLPSSTGIYRNGVNANRTLNQHTLMGETFKNQGYKTLGVGKLLHTFKFKEKDWTAFKKKYPDPKAKKKDIYAIADQFKIHPLDNALESKTMDALAADWAINQLNQQHDKPFFLAAGIYRPHLLWRVPKRLYNQFPSENLSRPPFNPNDLDDVGETAIAWALQGKDQHSDDKGTSIEDSPHSRIEKANDWEKGIQAYLASIKHADNQVGRILDALDRSAHASNTIIVLWSDHGWHLGEKLHWRKATLWEESTRVPFIMSIPGVTQAGSRSNEAVSLVDLYPTLTDLLNLNAPKNLDGASLLPLLKDSNSKRNRSAITEYYRGNVAVRDDRYRYIRYANGDEELYDHKKDPNEWDNIANEAKYSAAKARLSRSIPSHFAKEPTPPQN